MGKSKESESVWDAILLGKSKEPSTIHFARLFALLDLPIKSRSDLKINGVSYIPITFENRNPESIKRKLNRWRQQNQGLNLSKEIQNLVDQKYSQYKFAILEIPTNRESICPLFVRTESTFFVLLLLNDVQAEFRFRKVPGFRWDKYECKVLKINKRKFWEKLGEWSHNAMSDPIRNADSGLFEYVLLNGLSMADLKETTWRARHKGFYSPTISSFTVALKKFLVGKARRTSKKIR